MSSILDKEIVIYGAGSGFYTLSTFVLTKYEITPYLVLDKKFDAVKSFEGINAASANNYEASEDEKKNSVVIVSVGSKQKYQEIYQQLHHELGFERVIWAFDIFEYSLHYTPIEQMNNSQQLINDKSGEIMQAYNLLADDESRDVFKAILTLYYSKNSITIPSHPIYEQYFPEDVHLHKGFDCFIDCGAYIGDTVKQLTEKVRDNLNTVICFEPDLYHYKALLTQVKLLTTEQVITFPCGVYSDERLLQVNCSGSNSNISESGSSYIQTVALDHVLHGIKPTYIKMDIEGAEKEALLGSVGIIKEYEPDLAISVYHLVEHLWELPNLIASFGVGYQFYLRNYTSHISETVLYATLAD
jgi:FkbM family methyltransferase